jgi:uncharacterized protein (TIRG00374 family)
MPWLKSLPALLWVAALILFGAVLSQLPFAAIARTIGAVSLRQWLIWTGLNLGIILLATRRWQVLSNLLKLPVKFSELLMIRQAGQTVSFITPGPQFGGEPLQVHWLCKQRQLPIHGTVLALGLDRFYELWVNFGMLALGVLLLLVSPTGDAANWREVLAILATILLTLFLLARLILTQPERAPAWLMPLSRQYRKHPRLQNIGSHWQRLSSDLKQTVAGQKPALLVALMISLCGWVGLIGELWLLLSIFDLALNTSAFLVILVAMRLAFLLPLPGGVGSLEAALFWAFQYLSLPAEAAIGLIALMRLRDGLLLILGLWCLGFLHARK